MLRSLLLNSFIFSCLVCLSVTTGEAQAPAPQGASGGRATVLKELTACRAIRDDDARLACFDHGVAVLDEAERNRQVVVVEREQVQAAKRSLFGLSLPSIRLFQDSGEDAEIREIDSTITRVERLAYDKLLFVLADGSKWRQVDQRSVALPPKAGTPVKVRRGVTTNFRLTFAGIGVAVRREN